MRANTFLFTIALLPLLLAGLAAPVQAQAALELPAFYDEALEETQGDTYGDWQPALEKVTFFLDHDDPFSRQAGPDGEDILLPGANIEGYYHYEPPVATIPPSEQLNGQTDPNHPSDKRARISDVPLSGSTAVFDIPMDASVDPGDLTPNRPFRVYGFEANLFVTCPDVTLEFAPVIGVGFDRMIIQPDGTAQRKSYDDSSDNDFFETLIPGSPLPTRLGGQVYRYDLSTEESGNFELRSGHRGEVFIPGEHFIRFKVFVSVPSSAGADCTLHFGSTQFPSNFRLITDTAVLNTWVDDRNGAFTAGLPSADEVSQDRRRMTAMVAQGSAWASLNDFQHRAAEAADYQDHIWTPKLYDESDDPDVDGNDVNTGKERYFLRWRNVDTSEVLFDTRVEEGSTSGDQRNTHIKSSGSRTATFVDDSLNQVSQDFLYTADLPDGRYRFEVYNAVRTYAQSTDVIVGLKGFSMEVIGEAPGSSPVHEVEVAEPTEYLLSLRNLGPEKDNIRFSVSGLATGWTAQFSQDSIFLPPAGREPTEQGIEVVLTVTPSPTAPVGTEETFLVTAASQVPEEVPDQSLSITTRIVDEKADAVDIFGGRQNIEVQPGQRINITGFRLHNLGSAGDTYLVEPTLPSNLGLGWNARMDPPGRFIPADSISGFFTLKLNVAEDARAGTSFNLPLTARLVGDDSVVDTLTVQVDVVLERQLEIDVLGSDKPLRHLRFPSESCLPPGRDDTTDLDPSNVCGINDNEYDATSLFRIRFTNPGPVDETYSLRGDWQTGEVLDTGKRSVQTTGLLGCDGSGSPDYWRIDLDEQGGSKINNEPGGKASMAPANLGAVTVPAGQTVYRWVEMGYVYPEDPDSLTFFPNADVCGRNDVSDAAWYRIVATVDSEPGIKRELNLYSVLDEVGDRTHGVVVEPALDLETSRPTGDKESEFGTVSQEFEPVEYLFTVRTTGNERDDVTVSVPGGGNGWTEELVYVQGGAARSDYGGCGGLGTAPYRTLVCNDMGIYDEVTLKLVVRPDTTNKPGDRDLRHVITVASQEGGSQDTLTDTLTFDTKLVGEAQFEARTVLNARDAHAGQEVALPFQVDNVGTGDDTYSVVVVDGSPDWRPRLSVDDQVFVPGQNTLDAFLRVQVPDDAETGDREEFAVRIDSADEDLAPRTLTFAVNVVEDGGIVIQGVGGQNTVLIEGRGQPQEITVEAITLEGSVGDPLTLRVDRNKLPSGWSVTSAVETAALEADAGGYKATATFEVTSPLDAIGTSSVALIVEACRGDQQECGDSVGYTASGDLVLNLQDDVGVFLSLDDPDVATATLPGGDVVFPVRVQNAGLSADVVELSATQPPPGWSIAYDPPLVNLAPLETRVIDVIVSSPTEADGAEPGDEANILLFGTSGVDPSAFDQLELTASIGTFGLEWSSDEEVAHAAPGDVTTFIATVWNNGTLPDGVVGTPGFATAEAAAAYGDAVDVRVEPSAFELEPGKRQDVRVFVDFGPSVQPGVTVPVQVEFASFHDVPDGVPSTVTPAFQVEVLGYVAADVDRDGIVEFAIDRNRDRSDGFEEFRESDASAGIQTKPAQLTRFLSDEGRLRHTVSTAGDDGETVQAVVLRVDGDPAADGFGDGRRDHLLDNDGDGLPDLYWDPDDDHFHEVEVFKDIDADGVPDYFLDTSGNGEVNAVYDLADGLFVTLLARDVDNDGIPDFVVDKNDNGVVDGDETVLFTREGLLVQVTKVDVDGDGRLDDVFDTDGDGVPDYFVPAGKTKGVPITVDRDLNEDGFLDWTYDANRDGRDDHFYDPAAQSGGHEIDAQAEFLRSLQDYWYVGVLFVLVAALFVVLVAVTRR